MVPKFQVKDVALARQKIVPDINTGHCPKVTPHDGHSYSFGHARRIVVAFFNFLQRRSAQAIIWIFLFVEVCHARVNIPAVVVELL